MSNAHHVEYGVLQEEDKRACKRDFLACIYISYQMTLLLLLQWKSSSFFIEETSSEEVS